MSDFSDYSFQQPAGAPPDPASPFRTRRVQLLVASVVVLLTALVYVFVFRDTADDPSAIVEAPAPAPEPVSAPVEAAPPPIAVPPLDQSDSMVRDLVRALSSHPKVAAWLATDDLIRNFAVVVENISNGQTPTPHLQVWRPDTGFTIVEDDDSMILDSRTYVRYADVADAVNGIDPDGAGQLHATLKPRLQEAYEELGYQQSFDLALERAIVLLLRTPVSDEVVLLESAGALYAFRDPALEGLTPAQKQLLRMGPRNARIVQAKLREIAQPVGIPSDRLP